VLFTFPSRYLFTIGLSGVFSLTRWSWLVQTGFLVPRPTQGTARIIFLSCTGLSPPMVAFSKNVPLQNMSPCSSPTTPVMPKQNRFGLFPLRSPLLGESLLFSFPVGNEMFQFPTFASWLPRISRLLGMGCPIRVPADRFVFANPRRLSQLVTPFFASESQGILRTPLVTFFENPRADSYSILYLLVLSYLLMI
jgi:hypothetical protein